MARTDTRMVETVTLSQAKQIVTALAASQSLLLLSAPGVVLKAPALAAQLEQLARREQSLLAPLVSLAGQLRPCADWHEAALAIRNASQEALLAALKQVQRRSGEWEALGDACFAVDPSSVLEAPDTRGPAPDALRALLLDSSSEAFIRHGWVLRQEPIKRVWNLWAAQCRVLACRYK